MESAQTGRGTFSEKDPFDPTSVSDATTKFNADLLATLEALPDTWSVPAAVVRKARAEGKGPFPLEPKLDKAHWIDVGETRVRVIEPEGPSTGTFLHIHGGGWTFGQADFQDPMLDRVTQATGLRCVSVEYSLAPEKRYPAANKDCLDAAKWAHALGGPLFIGGESAGAHLSLLTALEMRSLGLGVSGLVLIAGCFDLSLTPSVRNWGSEKLILNTRDIEVFVGNYVPSFMDLRSPSISPLYADLAGLPPCMLSVGTRDPLLDDSLFLHQRLMSAGVESSLSIAPGGCHVFHAYDLAIARDAEKLCHDFLNVQLERVS